MPHASEPAKRADPAPEHRSASPISATLELDGLAFPEGPVSLPDGRVAFVELDAGRISVLDGRRRTLVDVGGRPNGLAVGGAGELLVAQAGSIPGDDDLRARPPGILRVEPATRTVEIVAAAAGDQPLRAPNDLASGPGGTVVFTDPGRVVSGVAVTGWLCRIDGDACRRDATVGPVYPNGIVMSAAGEVVWTESITGRIMARPSAPYVLSHLPEGSVPDGCDWLDESTLLVAAFGQGSLVAVSIAAVDQMVLLRWPGLERPTNVMRSGSSLWITDAGPDGSTGAGRLWRVPASDVRRVVDERGG